MSPDRHWLALPSLYESWDVMRVALDSPRTIQPFSATRAQEVTPRISPGRALDRARERRVGHVRGVHLVVSGADGQAAGFRRRRWGTAVVSPMAAACYDYASGARVVVVQAPAIGRPLRCPAPPTETWILAVGSGNDQM